MTDFDCDDGGFDADTGDEQELDVLQQKKFRLPYSLGEEVMMKKIINSDDDHDDDDDDDSNEHAACMHQSNERIYGHETRIVRKCMPLCRGIHIYIYVYIYIYLICYMHLHRTCMCLVQAWCVCIQDMWVEVREWYLNRGTSPHCRPPKL